MPTNTNTLRSRSSDVSEPEWTLTESSLSELEISKTKSGYEEELAALESFESEKGTKSLSELEILKAESGYKEELATFESADAEKGTDVTNTAPFSMWLVNDSLLWCPNAKIATTTVYMILYELGLYPRGDRCKDCEQQAWKQLQGNSTMKSKVQKAVSFTLVRSPWERLRATYVGKILDEKTRLRGFDHVPSFVEFVAYVGQNLKENIHWQPVSTRCLTSPDEDGHVFHYDHIIRLKDGDMMPRLHQLFTEAGISVPDTAMVARNQHTPHTNDALIQFYRDAATPKMSMEDIIEAVGEIYRDDVEGGFQRNFKNNSRHKNHSRQHPEC